MRDALRSYTAYSIGCWAVWAAVLTITMATANHDTRGTT